MMMLKSAFFLVAALFAFGYSQTFVVSVTIANQSVADGKIVPVVLVEGSNSSIVFRCTTNDTGAVIVLDIAPSGLSEAPSVGNTDTDKEFTVNNIQRDDSGTTFQCSDGGDTSEFTIDVQFAPSVLSIIDGAGPEGGSANVTFTVDANPAVVESGIRVTPTMPDDIVIINGSTVTLTYDDLERSDDRSYSLYVNNSVDSTMRTFDIDVYFGPDFTNNGGSIEVTTGQPLSIDCSVSGSNPAVVSVTISGYDITGMMDVPDNGGSRVFTVTDDVTSSFNNRIYTCSASNGQTMTSITYTVAVVRPTSSSISIPAMPSSFSSMSTSISMSRNTGTDPTREPDPDLRRLSVGATVGIAVACIVVGIALIIVGIVVLALVFRKLRGSANKA